MMSNRSVQDLENFSEYNKELKVWELAVSYRNTKTSGWEESLIKSKYFYTLRLKIIMRDWFKSFNNRDVDLFMDLPYYKEKRWKTLWCMKNQLDEYERKNWKAAKKAYKNINQRSLGEDYE